MKRITIITMLLLAAITCSAQRAMYYSYDAAGNRISRTLRSQPAKKSRFVENDEDEIDVNGKKTVVKLTENGRLITVRFCGWEDTDHAAASLYSIDGKLFVSEKATSSMISIPVKSSYGNCVILTVRQAGVCNSWKIYAGK